MKPCQSGLHSLPAEPCESIHGLFNAPKAGDQAFQVIDLKERAAVDPVIRRVREIFPDQAGGYFLKLPAVDSGLPDDVAGFDVRQAPVPCVVDIMVGPHQVEFDTLIVASFKVAIVQALLKEGPVVIPVPVVDEDVHTMVRRGINLHFHDPRVSFIAVAPKRPARPCVAGEPGGRLAYSFPFAAAFRPKHEGARFEKRWHCLIT